MVHPVLLFLRVADMKKAFKREPTDASVMLGEFVSLPCEAPEGNPMPEVGLSSLLIDRLGSRLVVKASASRAADPESNPALGAGVAQLVVCWARCPASCNVVGSSLL